MSRLAVPSPLLRLGTRFARPRSGFDAQVVVTVAVVAGVLLRLAAWVHNRSFWLDEVYLALNITGRSLAGLCQPLDHDQGAPVGFLVLVKLVTYAAGTNEMALRLVPLAAGLSSLLIFPRVAGRLLPPGGAAFATALFAVTPKLIYYSSELKQYSSDVFFTLVLLDLATRSWGIRPRCLPMGALAAVGAVAVWFSHPALFVLAGFGLVLTLESWSRGDGRLRILIAVGAAWLASFAVCYVFCLRDLGRNAYLLSYWAEYFAPVPPRNFEELGWYARAVAWLFEGPAGMNVADVSMAAPAVLLFGIGVAYLFQSRPWLATGLLAPIGVTLAASALGRYPFGGRLLLFIVPILHLGLGAAWSAVRSAQRSPAAGLAVATAVVVLAAPALTAAQRLVRPQVQEDPRAAVAFIAEHWQPGDAVYLSAMAREPFGFYAARAGLEAPVLGRMLRKDWDSFVADLPELRGRQRVWLFIAHEQGSDHRYLTWTLDQNGTQVEKFRAPGAAAYLYDMRRPPTPAAPTAEKRTRATSSDASPIRHSGR